MVSPESTDMILDLLYDELTPEESLRAQELIAQDDDLQAEFNRLQATQAEFRETMPAEPVPSSVHAAIMAAAAAHIESTAPKTADILEETPFLAPRPPKSTIWSRISNTNRAQFTAVATVAALLLASAVLWRQMSDAPQSSFQSASVELAESVVLAEETATAEPPMAVALANEQAKANEPYEFETAEQTEEVEQESSPFAEGSGNYEVADQIVVRGSRADRSDRVPTRQSSPTSRPSAPARMTKKAAPAPAKRSVAKSRAYAKSSPREDSEVFDMFGSDSVASEPDVAAGSAGRGRGTPQSRPESEEKSAKVAPANDLDKTERVTENTASQTLQDAETALANREFSTAITRTDQTLKNQQATPDMRARALHIQAQAYTQQGNTSRADAAYKTLQSQYPAYRASEITRARSALAEKPASTKPRSKEPAQSDVMVPSSAD